MVVIHAIQPIHANWWIIWLFVYSLFFFRFLTEPIYLMSFGIRMRKRNMFLNDIFFFHPTILCYLFSNICLTSKNKGDSWHFNSDSFFLSIFLGRMWPEQIHIAIVRVLNERTHFNLCQNSSYRLDEMNVPERCIHIKHHKRWIETTLFII